MLDFHALPSPLWVLGTDTGVGKTFVSARIARAWAEKYHYPMQPHEREALPQVAQYLAINQDPGFPRDELSEYLCQELTRRYAASLPEKLRGGNAPLDDLLEQAAALRWARQP